MIKITSQDPIHKHIFTTLLHNIRYDVSLINGTVFKVGFNNQGTFKTEIKNSLLVKRFLFAVNHHVTNKNINIT